MNATQLAAEAKLFKAKRNGVSDHSKRRDTRFDLELHRQQEARARLDRQVAELEAALAAERQEASRLGGEVTRLEAALQEATKKKPRAPWGSKKKSAPEPVWNDRWLLGS